VPPLVLLISCFWDGIADKMSVPCVKIYAFVQDHVEKLIVEPSWWQPRNLDSMLFF